MPTVLLNFEKLIVQTLQASPLGFAAPFVREGIEAGYRVSQTVVFVPLSDWLTDLVSGRITDYRDVTQPLVNQFVITVMPLAILVRGYDELADLLNVEDSAYAAKRSFYQAVWDGLDPSGLLHRPGNPGI